MGKKINNKGFAVIYLAVAIIVLIGFVGLAVDIGYMYVAKGQLQNAADAAALAGAARLKLTNNASLFGNQSSARIAAQTFAGKNKAAGTPLTLDLNGNNNDPNGDIVVGNWDSTRPQSPDDLRFLPADGIADINAVKVVARRTGESGTGIGANTQISIFFGKIFSLLPGGGVGWPFMSAKSQAIAVPNPLGTPALALCIESCSGLSVPADLDIQDNSPPSPGLGVAWTAFSCKNQQIKQDDLIEFIWGRSTVTKLCDSCFTTDNGVKEAFKELGDAFSSTTYDRNNKTFNADGTVASWRVAVPVFDFHCSSQDSNCNVTALNAAVTGCPPGTSGGGFETKHVQRIAAITITAINSNPAPPIKKGIRISGIDCTDCSVSTSIPFSYKGSHLVK